MPLTPKQLAAARLSAAGKSNGVVASAVGVRPETVSRWKKLPEFVAAMDAAMGDGGAAIDGELAEFRAEVNGLVWTALETLRDAMTCPDERIRVTAAATVLKLLAASPQLGVEVNVALPE